MRRPVSAPSPVTSWFYNAGQAYHQAAIPAGHTYVTSTGTGIGDGYITIGMIFRKYSFENYFLIFVSAGSPQVIIQRMQDPSKELLAESQRVKMQLRNLEKQLNDLKLATQGVTTLSEGDRLTQELQLIEQGIQEKQKEAHLVSLHVIKGNRKVYFLSIFHKTVYIFKVKLFEIYWNFMVLNLLLFRG